MSVPSFLRRTSAVEQFKELREQKDNRFTLLELLDSQFVDAACTTGSYILTLNSQTLQLKCWSTRSAKQQNSVRLNNTSGNENFSLLAGTNTAILIASGYTESRFYIWNFMDKEAQILGVALRIEGKVLKSVMNTEILVTYSSNYEISFWQLGEHSDLGLIGTLAKKNVSEMEISLINNYLYFANSRTLSLAPNITEPLKERDTGEKIFSLHVVHLPGDMFVFTGHKQHVIKLWDQDIQLLKEVRLLEGPQAVLTSNTWLYRIFYLADRDELLISHNTHLSLVKVVPKKILHQKILHQELHAHRSEITAIECYTGDPACLVTLCESTLRLWRHIDQGPELVGEFAVANVDHVVPVAGVGLYLAGKCYNAGLVLWRDASAFLTAQLRAFRNLDQET